jgi:hypothetical protein
MIFCREVAVLRHRRTYEMEPDFIKTFLKDLGRIRTLRKITIPGSSIIEAWS